MTNIRNESVASYTYSGEVWHESKYRDFIESDLFNAGFRVFREFPSFSGPSDLAAIKYNDKNRTFDWCISDFIKNSSKSDLCEFLTGDVRRNLNMIDNLSPYTEFSFFNLDFRIIEIKRGLSIREAAHGVGQLLFYGQSYPRASLYLALVSNEYSDKIKLILDNLNINLHRDTSLREINQQCMSLTKKNSKDDALINAVKLDRLKALAAGRTALQQHRREINENLN